MNMAERESLFPRDPGLRVGDKIKVVDGTFVDMEGLIGEVRKDKGVVCVEIDIFGRCVPVELAFWQVRRV
jgi:transcriptional antiterminator NusG